MAHWNVSTKYDSHFSWTRDKTMINDQLRWTLGETLKHRFWLVYAKHNIAMDEVTPSDYEGALAELEVGRLGIPTLDGFLLREKGIMKRKMGDLDGALEDLTAALECFSRVDDGHYYSYDCWKHTGHVNFLMGDIGGAENDGKMALKLQLVYLRSGLLNRRVWKDDSRDDYLGEEFVEYMHFRLEGRQVMKKNVLLMLSSHSVVLQKVKASNFQGALAIWRAI